MSDQDLERAKTAWFVLSHLEADEVEKILASLIQEVRNETLEGLSAELLLSINTVANDNNRTNAEQVALIAKYSFARGQIEKFKSQTQHSKEGEGK